MSNHKIEFKFARHNFQYDLPILGVDLEFVAARKLEVIECMYQLAKKIPNINIASKEGVAAFSLANDLVKYYFYALVLLENKRKVLSGEMQEYAAPTEIYTGTLSQGK